VPRDFMGEATTTELKMAFEKKSGRCILE
jgi:hypothetical protein